MGAQMKLDFILSVLQELHPYEEINTDTELIESGLLDSLSILFLISKLEEEFDVEISEEYVQPEYFQTAKDILKLITSVD